MKFLRETVSAGGLDVSHGAEQVVQMERGVRHYGALGGRMHGLVEGAHAPRCWRWKVPQNFCGENLEVSNQAKKLQSRSAENGGAWFWGRPAGSIKPPGIAGTRKDPKSLHPPLLLLHPPGCTGYLVNVKFLAGKFADLSYVNG